MIATRTENTPYALTTGRVPGATSVVVIYVKTRDLTAPRVGARLRGQEFLETKWREPVLLSECRMGKAHLGSGPLYSVGVIAPHNGARGGLSKRAKLLSTKTLIIVPRAESRIEFWVRAPLNHTP